VFVRQGGIRAPIRRMPPRPGTPSRLWIRARVTFGTSQSFSRRFSSRSSFRYFRAVLASPLLTFLRAHERRWTHGAKKQTRAGARTL
jgi:hypothetical protein